MTEAEVPYRAAARQALAVVLRGAPGWAAGAALLSVVGAVLPVAVAWLTKLLFDQLFNGADPAGAVGFAIGLIATSVLAALVPQADQYVQAAMQRAIAIRTQDDLYAAVNGFPGLRRFEDPAFMNRLELAKQAAAGPGQVLESLFQLGRGVVTVGGLVVSLITLSPQMALALAVAAVPVLVAELRLSRRRVDTQHRISPNQRREFFYQSLFTNARAAKEVRMFGLDQFLRARVRQERRTADRARRDMERHELTVQGGLGLLGAVVAGAGLLWAVRAAAHGALSPGDVAMFVSAVAGVQGALGTVVTNIGSGHQAVIAFRHYLGVRLAQPDLPAGTDPVPPLRHGIELRDVWFRYAPDQPYVLRGVDLVIPADRAVALVGANGAGKSTLVKLLCRFYDPTRGSIHWDGTDLRTLDTDALRRRIGVLFQDYVAYDLTARENIGLGDLARLADREEIAGAARRAGVDDVLAALPHGYDTALTRIFAPDEQDSGTVLSGGQWQRVALARTLLRTGADFLILDEPNAGLDPDSEYLVHERLRTHRRGRASLLISHRLSAVRDADLIVVLDHGRVRERGRHADLVTAGGRYAELFRRQAAGYRTGIEVGAAGRRDP